jgi:hypothetical protein
MSLDEIRSAFVDDDRRRTEVAWIRSEVQRIRALAERLNANAHHGGDYLELAMGRYRPDSLRSMLPRAFSTIGGHEVLVNLLNQLIDQCTMADEAVAPLAAFEMQPKDRSYSGGGRTSVVDIVRQLAPQIAIISGTALDQLARVEL